MENNVTIREIAEKAIEGEKAAHAYYSKASECATRPRIKTLYKELARMEKGHLTILSRRFNIPVSAEASDCDLVEGAPGFDENEAGILTYAMKKEKEAVELYSTGLKISNDKATRDIFRQLIADEKYHYDLFRGLFVQLTGGEPDV